VGELGYPPEVAEYKYNPSYMLRGLAVDKARGNVLKIDRHKYVKLAFHGFRELSRKERLATYAEAPGRESYDEPDYALLDTLFSLGETYLYCQLVDLKDGGCPALAGKSYARMHADVRNAVDMCHRDGSLKAVVAAEPAKFIYPDPSLVQLLQTLRDSGRKTFLVTNSLWDYTNVVMNFLVGGRVGAAKTLDWTSNFDVIVTGACKPKFFEDERAAIFRVDPKTSSLFNTDNGAPLPYVGGADPLAVRPGLTLTAPHLLAEASEPAAAPVELFQGGCFRHLHAMLGVSSGSQVLYVGDHIFADVLRSKKTLGWRTALVVPELAAELRVAGGAEARAAAARFRGLRSRRDAMDDELQRLEWAARCGGARALSAAHALLAGEGVPPPSGEQQAAELLRARAATLRAERDALRELHRGELRAHHARYHPVWGQLLKTGYSNSRFASQVERFACLYTSHVGNFLAYSPDKSYRSKEDRLAHEDA